MADIQKALDWMVMKRNAGMRYSMDLRNSEYYSDCSSAVLRALRHAGFPVPWIGNTDAMFTWRGTLFSPINRSEIRAGDVFISGNPGSSGYAYGHTGFALNATQAIHSTSVVNGIAITSNSDSAVRAYSGAPVYWFRVIGSTGANPDPTPPDENPEEDKIYLEEEFVDHEYLQRIFGIKVDEVEFQDVESESDLKQKATDYMDGQLEAYHETSATVLELGLIDSNFDEIELGSKHVLKVDDYTTNGVRRIIRQELDLLEPELSRVTFGTKYKTLIDILAERN